MEKVKLHIISVTDAYELVNRLSEESQDEFMFTNFDESKVADPRTQMGIIYAMSEFDEIYLVNETNDGVFPEFIK